MNFFGALAKFRLTVSAAGFNMTINLLSLKNTLPFYIQPLGLFKGVTHKN
ncbi:hypothetical protein HMPREF9264_1781 [Lactobacillus delbrueckii subsp. bulgaricus PB2003/044-T3-4]|nr:hypothetical protein HMPREF9264_1781 [Lactobacillus delbrueckii subsp. bulgaricus PB2003/044-T3-4]